MRVVSPFEPFHTQPYFCSGHQGAPVSVTLTFSRTRAEGLPSGVDAIVATADLQGRAEPGGRLIGELVAEELGVLAGLGEIPEPGLVLLAGDFHDDPACAKRGRSGEVGPVWRAFADRFQTVAVVHGNQDVLTEVPSGATVLDGRQETIAGIRIAGICGIMGRQTRPQRRSPESYLQLYEHLLDGGPEILLSHCGPDEPSCGRIGDPAIREILQRKGETLAIFGHCHWPEPLTEIGANQALNVDGTVVVLTR